MLQRKKSNRLSAEQFSSFMESQQGIYFSLILLSDNGEHFDGIYFRGKPQKFAKIKFLLKTFQTKVLFRKRC